MMHYQRICDLLGIALTDEQDWACAWLEWHGKTFCVDFGYVNAVQLADEHAANHLPGCKWLRN